MTAPFVPPHFTAPRSFDGPGFRLEPLGAEHNERDHAAWMSSIDHIRATAGFESRDWPAPMSLEANLADLVRHAEDFENRTGFTYSILDGDDVIGCLYLYPSPSPDHDVDVRSWVTKECAELDVVVWQAVSLWLDEVWPFSNPEYARRTEGTQPR